MPRGPEASGSVSTRQYAVVFPRYGHLSMMSIQPGMVDIWCATGRFHGVSRAFSSDVALANLSSSPIPAAIHLNFSWRRPNVP